jgi:peptidoglycan hydrolase-like protein with peptidoglycan-binding domain
VISPSPVIPSTTPFSFTFTRNLNLGTSNSQVKSLQEYLNQHGFSVSITGPGSIGDETMYFGPATEAALIKFQKANGIRPAFGYFGPITRAYMSVH